MTTSNSIVGEKLSDAHIECVKESVISTFGTICGTEPVYQDGGENRLACDGVVGIISIVGNVAWTLMLGLPRDTATSLALKFAGFEIPFDSPDMGDVVGEMANVVAGDLIARLDCLGIAAKMSLPTVARGHDIEMLMPGGLVPVKMRFASPEGSFWLKLATAETGQQTGR